MLRREEMRENMSSLYAFSFKENISLVGGNLTTIKYTKSDRHCYLPNLDRLTGKEV